MPNSRSMGKQGALSTQWGIIEQYKKEGGFDTWYNMHEP
jgi:hypothetical protein